MRFLVFWIFGFSWYSQTLLRLHLPLNDKVWTSSHGQAPMKEPNHNPESSPDHSIGRCDGQLQPWHRRRQCPPFRQRRSTPLRSTTTVVLSLPEMPIRLPCSRGTPCHGRTRAISALPANRRRVRQAKPSRHGLSVRNPKPVHDPSRCRVRPAWNAPAKATITNPERVMAAPVWCLRGNRRK